MKLISSLFCLVLFTTKIMVFDFSKEVSIKQWFVTNDSVMGGLSSSKMSLNDQGNGVFSGTVSTDNNGGFAMTRVSLDIKGVRQTTKIQLRVKGDGKDYQLRLKSDKRQRYWYIKSFKTSKQWETIELDLKDFYPSFRGYRVNKENFNSDIIKELGVLIGNKRNENFELEIDWIQLN